MLCFTVRNKAPEHKYSITVFHWEAKGHSAAIGHYEESSVLCGKSLEDYWNVFLNRLIGSCCCFQCSGITLQK